MTFAGMLREIVAALDSAGIPHMLAGSAASSAHGEPRTTLDIDIVIDPSERSLRALLASLDPSRFYVGDAMTALAARDMFNVIDTVTGWKVDLIVIKDRPFSRSEFDRRQYFEIDGVETYLATAEDTILAKLEWARLGASERQQRDVVGILAMSNDSLDHTYLAKWADALGLGDDLTEAKRLAAG